MSKSRSKRQCNNIRPNNGALRSAVGQLTLIEHCLCPLDSRASLRENFVHKTSYGYTKNRKRLQASVRVSCPAGLTAEDEFYLWGLLSLTLSQPNPSPRLVATRHYCLRQLDKIDTSRRGGRQYQRLAESIERLSLITYRNDAFYDPIRREHRRVSFGFLSYSLPMREDSCRAWHIAWNPIFFEFCLAGRSMLTFDFNIYKQLDPASRRLFLFLHKLFWRYRKTPPIGVRELAMQIMGFSDSLTMAQWKRRIDRCVDRLRNLEVVSPEGSHYEKLGKGDYVARFTRGRYFDRPVKRPGKTLALESALADPLRTIGFSPSEVRRILQQFSQHLIEQWSDVTLAAMENKPASFFKRNPQAFFLHNVQKANPGDANAAGLVARATQTRITRTGPIRRSAHQSGNVFGFREYWRRDRGAHGLPRH